MKPRYLRNPESFFHCPLHIVCSHAPYCQCASHDPCRWRDPLKGTHDLCCRVEGVCKKNVMCVSHNWSLLLNPMKACTGSRAQSPEVEKRMCPKYHSVSMCPELLLQLKENTERSLGVGPSTQCNLQTAQASPCVKKTHGCCNKIHISPGLGIHTIHPFVHQPRSPGSRHDPSMGGPSWSSESMDPLDLDSLLHDSRHSSPREGRY